jgi:CubicO group peptidase (beta-lactamase class C family)
MRTAIAAAGVQHGFAEVSWPVSQPREAGFDPAQLNALKESLAGKQTNALLILKGGRVVLEWYAGGRTAAMKHSMASTTKALVGGTSLMLAMADGRIRANDLASKYIPAWREDPERSRITIRHLATHTSGIEDSSVPGIAHPNEPGWKGRFWKREPDPFTISLRDAPLLFEPGKGYQYSNPGMAALAYAVTASLRGAPQSNILSLLRDRVMRPLGVPDEQWSIGYGKPSEVDGLELYANWGGASYAPRTTARVIEWMMNGGEWDGRKLVAKRWVEQALKYAGLKLPDRSTDAFVPASGLCWYTNFDGVWPAVPRDAFAAAGAGHQIALAIPSLQLIIVRNGNALPPPDQRRFWTPVYREIFEPLMASLGNPAKPEPVPYQRSKAIRGIEFAPVETISRQAIGCDNWPMTWADDGDIYTSYGDGNGFEPMLPEKLGMGFAKIQGPAGGFKGLNIRSATGERKGDGPASAKASGMLMVDGVLYMFVRNVRNSQLVWSADHARTWNWGFKIEQGFGSPSFLNFGKNYEGARDDYVYAYSQDGASAYETYDGVSLARAPKNEIKEPGNWQFFSGFDSKGQPAWAPEAGSAKPVFRFPNHCQRVDALYHPATKRYLLAVAYGHNGGWGIFDAPAPWGPWSTVFHTGYWGLGETHGYRLSSKWMSEDGRAMALVFSGLIYDGSSYDAFCVRSMKLTY